MNDAKSGGTLETLPFEIRELIINLLARPHTLLALALCSRGWKESIIPEHLEYRDLAVRVGRYAVWKHLNSRPDLARRIVSLKLMSDRDPYPERFPTTLSGVSLRDGPWTEASTEALEALEMVVALPKLRSLERVTWLGAPRHGSSLFVLQALQELPQLSHVQLKNINLGPDISFASSPIWGFRNLEYLSLVGSLWRFGTQESWSALSSNLPHLRELAVSYISSHIPFAACRFPLLESVRFYFDESCRPIIEDYVESQDIPLLSRDESHSAILDFLAAHPGLKHLSYYPLVSTSLSSRPGILPNLVSIHASHSFACHVLCDSELISVRKMERIYQLMLKPNTVDLLSKLSGTIAAQSLKELRLARVATGMGLELIGKLAGMFPCVEVLEVDHIMFVLNADVTSVITLLSKFTNLRILFESTLWATLSALHRQAQACGPAAMAIATARDPRQLLASSCPRLEVIRLGAGARGNPVEMEVVFLRRDYEKGAISGGVDCEEQEVEFVERVVPGQRL